MIISILSIILMIIIHEFGHFIAGKLCKIPVYEFSVGFGPKIFQVQGKSETKYSLRAIPLGGYCAFDDISKSENLNGVTDLALDKLPFKKRAFICAAGPFMNIFLAFVLLFTVNMINGAPIYTTEIQSVEQNSVAETFLEPGDVICSINGINVENDLEKMSNLLSENTGAEEISVDVEYLRNGELKKADDIILSYDEEIGKYKFGIVMKSEMHGLGVIGSTKAALTECVSAIVSIYDSLFGMITGKYPASELGGIVMTVSVMSTFANDLLTFGTIAAYISVDLGIMNMLPFPPLDGFKIVTGIYEKIAKKKPNPKILTKITVFSTFTIIVLSVILMVADFVRL